MVDKENPLKPISSEELEKLKSDFYKATSGRTEEILEELKLRLSNLDPVKFLSAVSILLTSISSEELNKHTPLAGFPTMPFLAGHCLNSSIIGTMNPPLMEILVIMKLIEEYSIKHTLSLCSEEVLHSNLKESEVILHAKLRALSKQDIPDLYPFQKDLLFDELFSQFDDHLFKAYGFNSADIKNFVDKVLKNYKTHSGILSTLVDNLEEDYEKIMLSDKEKYNNLKKETGYSDEYIKMIYLVGARTSEAHNVFSFTPDQFCIEETLSEEESKRFKSFLQVLSCTFGDNKDNYKNILDDNCIISKPFIIFNSDKYFCPVIQMLSSKIHEIVESLILKDGTQRASYDDAKSKLTTSKVVEYFSRLFKTGQFFKEVKYARPGTSIIAGDIDCLIIYDNKIIIVEVKDKKFSKAAETGKPKSLKDKLEQIFQESYDQVTKARELIVNGNFDCFSNIQARTALKSSYDPNGTEFILISVTSENFHVLNTKLKMLQGFGLFTTNDYPWSVSLFNLDLITQHLPSAAALIHYIQSRLRAQDENVFFTPDELSLLGYYLKHGEIRTFSSDGEKSPNHIVLDGDYISLFDSKYSQNKEVDIFLNIPQEVIVTVKAIEREGWKGHSTITSTLLDMYPDEKEMFSKSMKDFFKICKDDPKKGAHSLTFHLSKSNLNIVFLFKDIDEENLASNLQFYSNLCKYRAKADKIIGLGFNLKQTPICLDAFFYNFDKWKHDDSMETALDELSMRIS